MLRSFGRAALLLIGLILGTLNAVPSLAATASFANQEGVAIQGYDAVAYWTESRALKGDALYNFRWNGVEWHFASAANRDSFAVNPTKFAPQFGGYCSYGMSLGRPVMADPTQWRIVQDKLYLHAHANAQQRWVQDIPGMITRGSDNWQKVKDAP